MELVIFVEEEHGTPGQLLTDAGKEKQPGYHVGRSLTGAKPHVLKREEAEPFPTWVPCIWRGSTLDTSTQLSQALL